MRICFKLIWYCNFLLCLPVPAVCRSHCLYGSTSVFYYYNDASFKAILLFSMSSYFNRSIIFLLFIQYNLSQQLVLCGSGVLLVWHNSGSFVSLLLCLFSVCALVIYRCCAYMSASAWVWKVGTSHCVARMIFRASLSPPMSDEMATQGWVGECDMWWPYCSSNMICFLVK